MKIMTDEKKQIYFVDEKHIYKIEDEKSGYENVSRGIFLGIDDFLEDANPKTYFLSNKVGKEKLATLQEIKGGITNSRDYGEGRKYSISYYPDGIEYFIKVKPYEEHEGRLSLKEIEDMVSIWC